MRPHYPTLPSGFCYCGRSDNFIGIFCLPRLAPCLLFQSCPDDVVLSRNASQLPILKGRFSQTSTGVGHHAKAAIIKWVIIVITDLTLRATARRTVEGARTGAGRHTIAVRAGDSPA